MSQIPLVPTKFQSIFKKIIFFWCIFHFVGYLSFLTAFTPSIDNTGIKAEQVINSSTGKTEYMHFLKGKEDFILTPHYNEYDYSSKDNSLDKFFSEKMYFYPFHSFVYGRGSSVSGFVGLWGYYGHHEFMFYIVLPLTIFLLTVFYKKYIANS